MGFIMRKYISALCVGLMILGLFSGCGSKIPVSDVSDDKTTEDNNDGDDVICGGTTTKQDPDAPKEIASKDIVAMDVSFYTDVRWDKEENHDFTFVISEENGELVASEPNIGMSEVADEELLTKLQDVIDDEKLVSRNGLYDVTAGLPPEYQESPSRLLMSRERNYISLKIIIRRRAGLLSSTIFLWSGSRRRVTTDYILRKRPRRSRG